METSTRKSAASIALPALGLAGRVLKMLSSSEGGYSQEESASSAGATKLLDQAFPELRENLSGAHILDFGCGSGRQAVALAHCGAKVTALDIQSDYLERGRRMAATEGVADRVDFVSGVPSGRRFDWVLSQNSMEHFSDPESVLREMSQYLVPSGRLLITFCPTWLSPYGAHMHFFTKVPWVHLLFSERAVMAVRARYKSDGAMRYEDVPGGLNRMTVKKFRGLCGRVGLKTESERNEYVRDLRGVASVPGLEEFFTNRVSCVLMIP